MSFKDTPARGDPVRHFGPVLPATVVSSLTRGGNIKSIAHDNRQGQFKKHKMKLHFQSYVHHF